MDVIHEAIQDGYHFIVGETYLTVTKDGLEMVHLNREQAKEVVEWMHSKLNRILPETILVPAPTAAYYPALKAPVTSTAKQLLPDNDTLAKREPVSTSTVGDPFLAHGGSDKLPDGRRGIHGIEYVDLGEEVRRLGPH